MSAATLLTIAALVQAQPCPAAVELPAGTDIPLATTLPLSSQTAATGDMVALIVTDDVRVGGAVVIPRGTPATGQIAEARATGGFGVDGRLSLRPLYIRLGTRTVRLSGGSTRDGGVNAGQVAGMVMLTPIFSGRKSLLPGGTAVPATVAKAVTLGAPIPGC